MKKRAPIIVAHRGLHQTVPENSLAAFEAAITAGVKWVECDVWPCADGVAVVIHDQTVDRTTTGTGKVSDLTWRECEKLSLPSLDQVFDLVKGQAGVLVEIKPPNARAFTETIRNRFCGQENACTIQSFHSENLRPETDPLLVDKMDQLTLAVASGWPGIHPRHSLIDRALVDRLHDAGRTIGAWTVNAAADIARMIELGVDMLITDEPQLAAEMIARRSP